MAAPAVQNLNDVVSSITAANQPTLANLDQQDADITNSATASTAGINADKDTAFGQITQQAGNRGALFSGFTPDAQAKYTASTYLPALAKLQQTITDSRTALAGQKATLLSGINTQANNQVQSEQSALQQWQDQQDATAAANAQAEKTLQEQEAFTSSQSQSSYAQQQKLQQEAEAASASQQAASIKATSANSAADRAATLAAASAKTAASTPTQVQALSSLFNATDSNGTLARNDDRYTENVVIPTLAQDFGLSMNDAASAAYQFRKQYYGN